MDKFPFPLVTAVDGEPRASSEVIARGVKVQHKNVMELIRRHRTSLEQFGPLAFQTRKGKALPQGGFAKATELVMLNEHQAALIISFMRNSPDVVEFKVRLIREFFRMRDELQNQGRNLWAQMQALIAREVESKVRASFGAHLMNERKRDIPPLRSERERLEADLQPHLFTIQ